jgi:tetratricopeptide (TPR) repeat protein
MSALSKLVRSLMFLISLAWVVFFPLVFLPTTSNFYEPNKLLFTVITLIALLFGWALLIITEQEFTLTITPLTLPTIILGAVFAIGSFIAPGNRAEALMGRGSLFLALALISLIMSSALKNRRSVTALLYGYLASATILALISISQALGFGVSNFINQVLGTTIPNTLAFTPAGSPLSLVSLLASAIVIAVFLAFSRKEALEKAVFFLTGAVLTSGLILIVLYSYPGKDTAPVILPPQYGYAIAMETLKNTATALTGYGPEGFVIAYNKTRPAALNLTPYWNIRFTSSSNELFQAVTTGGVLALVAWGLIIAAIIRLARKNLKDPNERIIKFISLGLLFLFLLLPGTYVHLFAFFVFITLYSLMLKVNHVSAHTVKLSLNSISLVRGDSQDDDRKESPLVLLPYLLAAPIIVAALYLGYQTNQMYAAETTFKKALDAAARNEGVPTYDLQRETIVKYPLVPRYRRAYAATNLALANSIAGKETLSDEDKTNVTQLIQQAIREAKAAVTLDPQNAANWENLATVYRALIGVAQNADSWTIASLAQAIQADPFNPRLRLELGGVFYSVGQYDQAIRLYQQSSELKPDWANAYYNLSSAYRQKKDLNTAFDYLRQSLSLVPQDSADYAKAQAELEELSQQLGDTQPAAEPAQVELAAPTPAPTLNPQTQVELGTGAGPEQLNPSPLPTPTSESVVSPEPTAPTQPAQ